MFYFCRCYLVESNPIPGVKVESGPAVHRIPDHRLLPDEPLGFLTQSTDKKNEKSETTKKNTKNKYIRTELNI